MNSEELLALLPVGVLEDEDYARLALLCLDQAGMKSHDQELLADRLRHLNLLSENKR